MKNVRPFQPFIILLPLLLFSLTLAIFFAPPTVAKADPNSMPLLEEHDNQATKSLEKLTELWNHTAPTRLLQRVYQRLAALDGYSFNSTIVQTTHPLPTVANIGLSSKTDSMLVNGTIDSQNDLTQLNLLEQSGNLLDGAGQIELKVQKGEVWAKVQDRGWEKLDPSSTPDKNSSEPTAFLQATRNVQLMGVEERANQEFQIYSFELDGPRWALLMQQEMQKEMQRKGELAPGQMIDALEYYKKMTGQGEVWLNKAGLPQRIKLHAIYPPLPNETEYREIELTSDYDNWRGQDKSMLLSLQSGIDRFTTEWTQDIPGTAQEAGNAAFLLFALLSLILLPFMIVRYRRSMWLHRGIVLALISLFIIEPLLSSGAVQAATERRENRTGALLAEKSENKRIQEAVDKIKAEFNSNFDVHEGLMNQQATEANQWLNAASPAEIDAINQNNVLYAAAAVSGIDSDKDGLSDMLEAELKTDPAKKDSDGDGIDDGTEFNTLGLNPTDPDTDGDLLSDGFEIAGIQLGGKTWYLNPQNRDTNGDNITDSLECIQAIDVVVDAKGKGTKGAPKGTGSCDDSDGDNIPDFADDDNDNDNVWDWLDGQPQGRFGDQTNGVKDKTFSYAIDNYTSGKPLRLTFEIRPTDPQHLWYSMNVLDWPSGDYEGQIRRVHDTTIGTSGSLANGDMQLVPMIEVIIPAAEAIHLPTIVGKQPVVGDNNRLAEWLDMPVLERYQMAVSWTQDQKSLRIYLPATLIRDTRGNAPMNFVAKMLYIPNGSGLFSTNHTMRLVWLVQLDTDFCTPPDDSSYQESCLPTGKNYQNGTFWKTAKQQIVHRYYDDFYLNAFTAEEDLGVNSQIFYEDPNQIANKAAYTPDQLLGFGSLLELYLRQGKSPAAALQAYKAKSPTIGNRLASTNLIQDPETYGLMSKVATAATPNLLESVFKPHKDQLPYPTMLFVTWGKSKINGLSALSNDANLKLNMSDAKLKADTSVRLGTFTYNPNPTTIGGKTNPNWNSVDPGTVWTTYLKNQSIQAYEQMPQATQQKIDVDQFQQSALSLYWNLARGTELPTDFESAQAQSNDNATGAIDEFGAAFDNGGNNSIAAMIGVLDDFQEAAQNIGTSKATADTAKLLGKLSGKDVKNLANVKGALTSSKWAKGIGTSAVTFAGLSATVSLVLAFKDQLGLSEGAVTALEAVNAAMGAVLAGLQVAQEITKIVQTAQAFSGTAMEGLKSALTFSSEVSKAAAIVAIIIVAVIIVVALVMFFKLLSDGNPVAAKTALAQGVATAVVVLLLFVIGLFFPIGTAIAAIVGLLDGIFTAICKIANWAGGKDQDGKTFEDRNKTFCNGIVGNTVAAIAGLFYRSKPMVDMTYKDRLQFGQTDTKLIEQNGLTGMSADNKLEVKQPITVTVSIPDIHALNPREPLTPTLVYSNNIAIDGGTSPLMPLNEYDRLIKEKSSFNYELITDVDKLSDEGAAFIRTSDKWQSVGDNNSRQRLYKVEVPTLQITLSAGINWKPSLQLREFYEFPLAECGLFAGGCDYKIEQFSKFENNKNEGKSESEKKKQEIFDLGKNLIYDVFPATLSEFYTLQQVQEDGQFINRYRLAWGGSDKPFPTLMDADGDGLRSDGTGALDPDDKTGDKDGDGLPDAFEMQDYRLDPSIADSDKDGLNDYQETRYATRPDRSDSDNDGLNDADEINGWEFVYVDADNVSKRTWVTSDPLVYDTDGDGFSDQQERVFGFHPRARTLDPKILSLRTSTNQTGSTYLGPQQSIAFTSTVKNELRKPIAYGLLEAEILNSNSVINPVTFELQPQQSSDVKGTITVPATPPSANSDEITLRNRAGANMVDPSASYASQLQGLAQPDGLKFQLNFEQRPANERNFKDATGNATLICADPYCPSVIRTTDSYGAFRSSNWYAATGETLGFTQAKFSVGGWVTVRKAFGGKYSERVLFGPDNVDAAVDKYIQLSLVDLLGTPKVKVGFTATDGAKCDQVLTALTLENDQKTHIFVTYDGTLVRGYKNGVEVGSYALQNCANKVPAGNRFTIGRGASEATLYVNNVYFRGIDEGSGWLSSAEPYLQLNEEKSPIWAKEGVKNGDTPGVGVEKTLRDSTMSDGNSTVYICEEDRGDKQGKCKSDSSIDSDDFHGTVTIDPRINREYDSGWSSGEGSGNLRYNVQNNFFHGDLDDLRIYESTLNAREISQIVNGGGLVYQLDEASGRSQFRNAGTDTTQLVCQNAGNCPTSGLKGFSGQAIRFDGTANQTLAIAKLRQRFGSNFIVSFWFKPEANRSTNQAVPFIRSGQGSEGYTLYAISNGTQTALNSRFMFNETGYSTIGGSGGTDFSLRCNNNEALAGIYGGAGGLIDRVGALCVAIGSSGEWLGDPRQIGTSGGGGGGSYERRCDRNQAVVGFSGRSGGLVDQITLKCAPLGADGIAKTLNRTALATVGSGGGNAQDERICPSNLPASGIRGRSGGAVDSFGLLCRDGFSGNGSTLIPNGQWSHLALAQSDDTLMLYINGQFKQNIWFGAPSLHQYRLNSNYTPDLVLGGGLAGLMDEVQIQGLSTNSKQTAQVGGSGGGDFNIACAPNQALVGLYGGAGGRVDRVGAICAVVNESGQWVGEPMRAGKAGGSGGSDFERLCPSNSAVSGFKSRTGDSVEQVTLTCGALAENGNVNSNSSPLSQIGGTGGSEQPQTNCATNLPATGIYGRAGAEIDAFGLLCGALAHESVRKIYRESAVVYLSMDETTGSTTFVNGTGKGNLICANSNDCPQAGIKGQVRESLLFNGQPNGPGVTISDQRNEAFSFSAWVKLPSLPTGSAKLVALESGTGSDAWRLQVTNKNGQIVPEFVGLTTSDGNSCSGAFSVTPKDKNNNELNLALNQWYHVGVSYNPLDNNNDLSLYINGQLVYQQRMSALICRVGTTLRFGQNLKGQLDEFLFYAKPLVVTEFLSQYVYQNTWYDVVSSEKFKVDYKAPTVKLTSNSYLKAGTTIFGVAVSDAESGIKTVEYKDNDGVWKSARSETLTSGVWAFALDIQGSKTVEVRATDNVGNVANDSRTVSVDNSPPTISLSTSSKQTTLSLAGTASDSGSGLQSATIMIIDPLGNPMNSPRDLAVAPNGAWHYTQELPPVVNGTLQIWASAVDQMGNRFEGTIGSVQVDNAAPVIGLMTDKLSYSGVGNTLPVVRGFVSDQPFPDGMKLFIGFEDLPTSGTVNSTLDMSGDQWKAVPLAGTSGPAILFTSPNHQADFQPGQTLVITNANAALQNRSFIVDPNNATISLWINPNSVAISEQRILYQADQAGFGLILKGDQVSLRINRNGTAIDKDTGHRLVAGQWQRLTLSLEKNSQGAQEVKSWLNTVGGNTPGRSLTITGTESIAQSLQPLILGASSNGYAGKIDDLIVYARSFSELEARQLTNPALSLIQKVEVGFLHRQDKDDASKVVWKEATLDASNQAATTWQVQLPAELEGIYDISLRTSDTANNQRVVGGAWTGVIDTLAPRIVLSGTTAGSHQCLVTDFSLGRTIFSCAGAQNATGTTAANYNSGILPSAGLSWNAKWYQRLFARNRIPARLYALQLTGQNFFTATNTAESCDIYGNCSKCTVNNNDLSTPVCSVYSANAGTQSVLRSVAVETAFATSAFVTDAFTTGEESEADALLAQTELLGPDPFTATVHYERPDAYVPGTEPGTLTFSWANIDEPYTLIDDAVLAATRPFAASFTDAKTAIDWGESISATQYYVGWTLSETVVISDLTAYTTPGTHLQTLPDQGRYYAHVVAVDAEGEENAYMLGPIYFDGATPASYLNWDEYGVGEPYELWQDAQSATGQSCNLLSVDDRVSIYSNGTSARSETQTLYGTWNNEYLALHWNGLDVEQDGDLHLYLDTKSGGAIYAYDPYSSIDHATALVTMPERRQYQSGAVDRMLADFAVIVEDGSNMRFLQWNGSTWQDADKSLVKFQYKQGETILWLPLVTLGINPAAVDLSLVGFATEENRLQVWATLPGNNPLNSPEMLPEHALEKLAVENRLVNLQTSMRLSSNASVNNTLDNCPTNVLFDESVLDIQFMADPAGEVYDPVIYEGSKAAVPDDVEPVLASLCAGVSDTSDSPVCQLAAEVANNTGGGGPEVGPNGLLPATAGPNDKITYYATLRNLTSQDTGELALELASNLPNNGNTLAVGSLAPLETRVISFTETVDPNAAYDHSAVTIYAVETVENTDENITLSYEHEPHTVIHDIDRSAPFSAELTSLLFEDTIGTGEQMLEGIVFDQSLVKEVTLKTSLGETVTCDDTAQIDAFASDWFCAIHVPNTTPDGRVVTVELLATDIYGFRSGVIARWQLTVDNSAPQVSLLDETGLVAAQLDVTSAATETLTLDGLAGDDRLLAAVEVCDALQGFERCHAAELYDPTEALSNRLVSAAGATPLADEAYWFFETAIDAGIDTMSVPYTVTAYDAFGNATAQTLRIEIDTKAPTIALDVPPVTQIAFDEAFRLSGNVQDKGHFSHMELEVQTPLGEVEYYPISLESPANAYSLWFYELPFASEEFAMPGQYRYTILAYDAMGNESELGPYALEVGAPAAPLLNAPFFITTTNDLWAGFAPGAPLYMQAFFDDDDLEFGDAITITSEPIPSWLVLTQLDDRTFEISGTVPLTITQPVNSGLITDTAQISNTATLTDGTPIHLSVGVILQDLSGQQAFQTWAYDVVPQAPSKIFLPLISKESAVDNHYKSIYLPLIQR